VPLQMFASDINEQALEKARSGLYTRQQVEGLSQERLKRFFVAEEGGFRICKPVRELCVFARHDIKSDPPFSRMDVVSCRNLLIYLEEPLQKRLLSVFHYALKTGGFLMLGNSQGGGLGGDFFTIESKPHRLYRKKVISPAPVPASPAKREPSGAQTWNTPGSARPNEIDIHKEADRIVLSEDGPAGVLVNQGLEILQFRGRTSNYLEPGPGKPNFNLLKMLREGLMLPVQSAVRKAAKTSEPVRLDRVPYRYDHKTRHTAVKIIPVRNPNDRAFLILFEEAHSSDHPASKPGAIDPRLIPSDLADAAREISRLRDELSAARQYLQSVTEQYDATNEELLSTNQEAQSANEELQSINEELETTKEELESTNEELTTVNEEMGARNVDLQRLNSDLNNVLDGVQMCIVVLDGELKIRRFTPVAERLLNLVPTDVGRPVTDIRPNIDLPELEKHLSAAIHHGQTTQREVTDKFGHWYSLRVMAYRARDEKAEGAVLVLADVDELKRTEQEMKRASDYAQGILRTTREPLIVLREDFRVNTANQAFYHHFQVSEKATVGSLLFDVGGGQWKNRRLRSLLEEVLPHNASFHDFELSANFEKLGQRTLLLNARPLSAPDGKLILLGIEDITEHLLQATVRQSERQYRRLFEAAKDGILIVDPVSRKIVDCNPFAGTLLGSAPEQLRTKELWQTGLFKSKAECAGAFLEMERHGQVRYHVALGNDGEMRSVDVLCNIYDEGERKIVQCNLRDNTERVRALAALAESEERFRTLVQTVPQLVWTARPDGQVTYLSPQWLEFTGDRGTEPSTSEKWSNALNPADRPYALQAWKTSIENGTDYRLEQRLRGADGQYRWFQTRAVPVRDAQGNISRWVGTCTDIQSQKAIEQELREARDQLQILANDLEHQVAERTASLRETVGELEAFSYSISHDLRAPLRAMEGYARLLRERCAPKLAPQEAQWLEKISRSAERLDELIRDVLNYAKVIRAQAPLGRVELNQMLGDLWDSYNFREKQAELEVEGFCQPFGGTPRCSSSACPIFLGTPSSSSHRVSNPGSRSGLKSAKNNPNRLRNKTLGGSVCASRTTELASLQKTIDAFSACLNASTHKRNTREPELV
jgi:PAS domain S-box-containing protein